MARTVAAGTDSVGAGDDPPEPPAMPSTRASLRPAVAAGRGDDPPRIPPHAPTPHPPPHFPFTVPSMAGKPAVAAGISWPGEITRDDAGHRETPRETAGCAAAGKRGRCLGRRKSGRRCAGGAVHCLGLAGTGAGCLRDGGTPRV